VAAASFRDHCQLQKLTQTICWLMLKASSLDVVGQIADRFINGGNCDGNVARSWRFYAEMTLLVR